MEGEDITLPSASVTDLENPTEVVKGEQVPVEITEVDEISEVIAKHTRGIFGFEDGSNLFFEQRSQRRCCGNFEICWKSW